LLLSFFIWALSGDRCAGKRAFRDHRHLEYSANSLSSSPLIHHVHHVDVDHLQPPALPHPSLPIVGRSVVKHNSARSAAKSQQWNPLNALTLLNSQQGISKQDHDLDALDLNLLKERHNNNSNQCRTLRRTAAPASSGAAFKALASSTSLLRRRVSVFLHLPSVPDQTA
jgi:hypothetical protein